MYTTQPVRWRRHPTTGQWSPYSSPRLVLCTTPPVRRRGGTWRLGSGLRTLRQGLQPREETHVAHTIVFRDRRMSMDRKVLLYWSIFQRTTPNRPLCGHNESPQRWSSPLHSNRPPVKQRSVDAILPLRRIPHLAVKA